MLLLHFATSPSPLTSQDLLLTPPPALHVNLLKQGCRASATSSHIWQRECTRNSHKLCLPFFNRKTGGILIEAMSFATQTTTTDWRISKGNMSDSVYIYTWISEPKTGLAKTGAIQQLKVSLVGFLLQPWGWAPPAAIPGNDWRKLRCLGAWLVLAANCVWNKTSVRRAEKQPWQRLPLHPPEGRHTVFSSTPSPLTAQGGTLPNQQTVTSTAHYSCWRSPRSKGLCWLSHIVPFHDICLRWTSCWKNVFVIGVVVVISGQESPSTSTIAQIDGTGRTHT